MTEKPCVLPPRFSISKAHNTQTRLSRKIIIEDHLPQKIELVAGVDVAYVNDMAIGAAAVLDYESLELKESQTAISKIKLPYLSTLLAFREIPAALACIKKLRLKPDVFLVDGQGIAHPFRCGFASHLGLAIGKPTIGVAKSKLSGEPTRIGAELLLACNGDIVGSAVTTLEGRKPIYVSIGHFLSLATAVKIVKHCISNSRIPEPLRWAHKLAQGQRTPLKRNETQKT